MKTPEQIAAGLLRLFCSKVVRRALREIEDGKYAWHWRKDGSFHNCNRSFALGYYPQDRHFVWACGWGHGHRTWWPEHWLLMRASRAILKEQADGK